MTEIHFRKTYSEFFDFVSNTQDELIVLSPYIKLEPLKQLLKNVLPGVKVIVVARWKLSDLVFGSSDIEVFEYLKSLNHNFYINKKIHLKIIVKDKKEILIGSANITGSGLGLFDPSNIEAIAIDTLDEKYLPEVYSILRESLMVDSDLVKKISKQLEKFQDMKEEQEKVGEKLEKIEDLVFVKSKRNILVHDFPFTSTPAALLKSIKEGKPNDEVKHDLKILGLENNEIDLEGLKQAFLKSDAYLWQRENVEGKALFGRYSELLHNGVVDNPKPYRKQIKELVANMFDWTEEFSDEFEIVRHEHTASIMRK